MALGIAPRLVAIVLYIPAGFTLIAGTSQWACLVVIFAGTAILLLGPGPYAMWQPEAKLFQHRLGDIVPAADAKANPQSPGLGGRPFVVGLGVQTGFLACRAAGSAAPDAWQRAHPGWAQCTSLAQSHCSMAGVFAFTAGGFSLFTLLPYRLSAFAVSYFTPGPQFGGEPVQVWSLHRHGIDTATGTASVVLDKLLELLVNFAVLAAGAVAILMVGLWPLRNPTLFLVLAFVLLALPLFYLVLLWQGKQPFRWLARRWVHNDEASKVDRIIKMLVESEHQAGLVCQEQPRILFVGLFWSMVAWALMLIEFGLSARFLGIDLTPMQVLAVLALARFAFLLPMPAGLGVLESIQVIAITALWAMMPLLQLLWFYGFVPETSLSVASASCYWADYSALPRIRARISNW